MEPTRIRFGDGQNNTLTLADVEALRHNISLVFNHEEASDDHAVLLEAIGPNYCTGMNLLELKENIDGASSKSEIEDRCFTFIRRYYSLFVELLDLRNKFRTATMCRGRVLGAGLTIACIVDVSSIDSETETTKGGVAKRFASTIGMPEVRFGLPYPYISAPFLIQKIGLASFVRYMEERYFVFRDSFDDGLIGARQALDFGFFDAVDTSETKLLKLVRNKRRETPALEMPDSNLPTDMLAELRSISEIGPERIGDECVARFAAFIAREPWHLERLTTALS